MKLHFEPDLDYQQQAIEAVCDLFRGQETCRTEFTVSLHANDPDQPSLGFQEQGQGTGNRLALDDDRLLRNLQEVQLRNGLPVSPTLASGDFTVEMETGTGKTYVYLRTIFELNRRYGFSKFAIVVPSVAIKEGVRKTLEITKAHFEGLYAGVPFSYFAYDSSKLGQIRNFATSSHIQIMVMTVGAINKKDVNNLYKETEKVGGEENEKRPIDVIRKIQPILIVDEPQSVDGGMEGRGKEALDAMNPLCTLRYSATHVDKHQMVYRLNAVDAYERKLVKHIEVASATIENAHNKPFVRLVKVENKRGVISARIELDVETGKRIDRKEISVLEDSDLAELSRRDLYAGFRIGTLSTRSSRTEESLELRLPGEEILLKTSEAYEDVEPLALQRQMIRRTIHAHLDKELRLRPQGIKVLSLFFIEEVSKYRRYNAEGNPEKGPYAGIFEEEYRRAAKLPRYNTLFQEVDLSHAPEEVHEGYFSIDKKGSWADTAENNQTNRDSAERAYHLIMRDKEKLLSLDTPLKFIFSHSALKEGWDNPNVFQICTLRDIRTERERRQTLGRGLRLCVNQNGDRVRDDQVNILTVIATESYEDYAEKLQKEYEDDAGIRFGTVEPHQFAALPVLNVDGIRDVLGASRSETLWHALGQAGYLDAKGKVQEALKQALRNQKVSLPPEFEEARAEIIEILRKASGRLDIKNADERRPVTLRTGDDGKAVILGADFQALWDRIKAKTTYRVAFDNARLIRDCISDVQQGPPIMGARLQWRMAELAIGKGGVEAVERSGSAAVALRENDLELPDILTDLQDRTQLTRRSLVEILTGSGRLQDFRRNPQEFIKLFAEIVNRRKRLALVDGIKYHKLGNQELYLQELFLDKEIEGYLRNLLTGTRKSVYDSILFDSDIERDFAQGLEDNNAVKLYAKLPSRFKVPTPLGPYNPDWAIVVEKDGEERLYFVVETKGDLLDLRDGEKGKIACGKAHFGALAESFGEANNPARYWVERSAEEFMARI
jgi:type III restriction enzyme